MAGGRTKQSQLQPSEDGGQCNNWDRWGIGKDQANHCLLEVRITTWKMKGWWWYGGRWQRWWWIPSKVLCVLEVCIIFTFMWSLVSHLTLWRMTMIRVVMMKGVILFQNWGCWNWEWSKGGGKEQFSCHKEAWERTAGSCQLHQQTSYKIHGKQTLSLFLQIFLPFLRRLRQILRRMIVELSLRWTELTRIFLG